HPGDDGAAAGGRECLRFVALPAQPLVTTGQAARDDVIDGQVRRVVGAAAAQAPRGHLPACQPSGSGSPTWASRGFRRALGTTWSMRPTSNRTVASSWRSTAATTRMPPPLSAAPSPQAAHLRRRLLGTERPAGQGPDVAPDGRRGGHRGGGAGDPGRVP